MTASRAGFIGVQSLKTLLAMKYFVPILFLFTIFCFSCRSTSKWQSVDYDSTLSCDSLYTACVTNHQGEHVPERCRVYIDGDTLFFHFPAELPAYWGSMTIKVHNGQLSAQAGGVPFSFDSLSFRTLKQRLVLGKQHYAVNDTLCARCDITFEEHNRTTGKRITFYVRGTINEVIRSKDYNPLDSANFMMFDIHTAVRELGEPLSDELFTTEQLPEFRVELLNYLPASPDVWVRELTWDVSEEREISDGGIERLTVWYTQANDMCWLPVHFIRRNTDMQF